MKLSRTYKGCMVKRKYRQQKTLSLRKIVIKQHIFVECGILSILSARQEEKKLGVGLIF